MRKAERPKIEKGKTIPGHVFGCHMVVQFNPKHVESGLSNVFVTEIIDKINSIITTDDAELDWIVSMVGKN